MDDCERKYLGDQLRTLQIKCDLLSQQSEQQQQLMLQIKCTTKSKVDVEDRNRVRVIHFILFHFT